LLATADADYPQRLAMIDDAPPLLAVRAYGRDRFARGRHCRRRATPQLRRAVCRTACARTRECGFAVASGLARGIDAGAHRGSLASGNRCRAGREDTITSIRPSTRAWQIPFSRRERFVSEMPMGWQPRAADFPRRNRLISGLAAGVVIVEAAKRSGSLITARLALEQGRESVCGAGLAA